MGTKRSRPGPPRAARPRRQYHVYVIELSPDAVPAARQRERPLPRCVYVGQTAHPPEHRLAQHLAGDRTASRWVRRWGVRLRPDLYPAENPVATRAEAEALERQVAEALMAVGYVVYWG